MLHVMKDHLRAAETMAASEHTRETEVLDGVIRELKTASRAERLDRDEARKVQSDANRHRKESPGNDLRNAGSSHTGAALDPKAQAERVMDRRGHHLDTGHELLSKAISESNGAKNKRRPGFSPDMAVAEEHSVNVTHKGHVQVKAAGSAYPEATEGKEGKQVAHNAHEQVKGHHKAAALSHATNVQMHKSQVHLHKSRVQVKEQSNATYPPQKDRALHPGHRPAATNTRTPSGHGSHAVGHGARVVARDGTADALAQLSPALKTAAEHALETKALDRATLKEMSKKVTAGPLAPAAKGGVSEDTHEKRAHTQAALREKHSSSQEQQWLRHAPQTPDPRNDKVNLQMERNAELFSDKAHGARAAKDRKTSSTKYHNKMQPVSAL
jgi:hypothetical protein